MVKVSIIMPVYNAVDFLEKSISSIVNQTLNDVEIICVDDGSTDNSLDKLEELKIEYDIIKIISQNNQGSGKARNTGLKNASGEYIAFLDADDIYLDSQSLEIMYNCAIENDANMVSANLQFIETDYNFRENWHYRNNDYAYFDSYGVISPKDYGIPYAFYKNIFNREFLIKNDICFPDLLRGQDPVFLAKVLVNSHKIFTVPLDFYGYNYSVGGGVNIKVNNYEKKFSYLKHFKDTCDILKEGNLINCSEIYKTHLLSYLTWHDNVYDEDLYLIYNNLFGDIENYFDTNNEKFMQFSILYNYYLLKNSDDEEFFSNVKNELSNYHYFKDDDVNKKLKLILKSKSIVDFKDVVTNKYKVSVIIPVYNVDKYIEECLDSIINQSLKDIEIICINDGSSDNSLDILYQYEKLDERVKVINQTNKGLGATRNVGLSLAKGEYIYFMDSDDYLELTALEELYLIAKDKLLDIVIFKLINFHDGSNDKFKSDYYEMKFLENRVNNKVFNYTDVKDCIFEIAVSAPGKLYKKSLISEMRFPENIIFEDNPFFTEAIFSAKNVYFYTKYLYNRRIRGDSITTSQFYNYSDAIDILNMIIGIVKKLGLFNEFGVDLYSRKINKIYFRFGLLPEEFKSDFFEKMKKDFSINKDEYESDSNFHKINQNLKDIFYHCLSSNDYKEFELNLSIINYKNEINSLKQTNKQLLDNVSSLQNNISNLNEKVSSLEKMNDYLKSENIKFNQLIKFFKYKNSNLLKENKLFKSTKSYKLWEKIFKN